MLVAVRFCTVTGKPYSFNDNQDKHFHEIFLMEKDITRNAGIEQYWQTTVGTSIYRLGLI